MTSATTTGPTTSAPATALRRPLLPVLLVALLLLVEALLLVPASGTDGAWRDTEHVAGGLAVRMPRDCTGDGRYAARSRASFLRGQLGPTDLAAVAGVGGLAVTNDGTAAVPDPLTALVAGPDAFRDPLTASAVQALAIDLSGAVQVPAPAQAVEVLGQYARSSDDGEAHAAAGAVTDSGSVLVGSSQAGAATLPSPAVLDLAALAPGSAGLAGARLRLGAVAAGARLDGCLRDEGAQTLQREYRIAHLSLDVASPAVTGLTTTTTTAVGTVAAAVDTLETALATTTRTVLGPTATATVTVDVDLQAAVAPLLQRRLSDGVVAVDLAAGTVAVDLAALRGASLDGLPPGTDVGPGPLTVAAVASRVDVLLQAWAEEVRVTVDQALRAARVRVVAAVDVLFVRVPVVIEGTLQQLITGGATVSAAGLPAGLLSSLLTALGPVVQLALVTAPTGAVPVLASTVRAAVPPVVTLSSVLMSAVRQAVGLHVNLHHDDPAADRWGVTALRVSVLAGSRAGGRVDLATAQVGPVSELGP